jgi:hypothetical protein
LGTFALAEKKINVFDEDNRAVTYQTTVPIAKIISVKNVLAWIGLNGFIFSKINENENIKKKKKS